MENSGGQTEEHYRGEKDERTHRERNEERQGHKTRYRIYEMRKQEKKDNRDRRRKERVCVLWLIPILVFWQLLRPAYCQRQASSPPHPLTLNLHLKQLFIPFIRCLDLLIPVQGHRGSQNGFYPNINWAEGGLVLHTANKHLSQKRSAGPVIKPLK